MVFCVPYVIPPFFIPFSLFCFKYFLVSYFNSLDFSFTILKIIFLVVILGIIFSTLPLHSIVWIEASLTATVERKSLPMELHVFHLPLFSYCHTKLDLYTSVYPPSQICNYYIIQLSFKSEKENRLYKVKVHLYYFFIYKYSYLHQCFLYLRVHSIVQYLFVLAQRTSV